MSMIKIYLYGPKKKVLVPTVAETEAGFFVEIEPLNIYEHHDVDGWTRGIARAMARGSQTVPTPDGDIEPGSQILDALHLNSWGEFEKEAVLFTVHRGRATSRSMPPDLVKTACGRQRPCLSENSTAERPWRPFLKPFAMTCSAIRT